MERGTVDVSKVYKHSQHIRIQQEQEEMWISSEDLRTDGSSDEEATGKIKSNKKSSKQLKNEKLLRKEVLTKTTPPSIDSFSEVEDKDVILRRRKSSMKPLMEEGETLPNYMEQLKMTPPGGAVASSSACGTSESDVEALYLESKWRPKRGSLKLPNLVEGMSVEV
ncbi:unnamed protein product [Brassicogethes aeneus]|uniref:Uncharacterized protein n=1 Tax=Brassicogethes aeneus TaxID=1431903 RepID=A0A9P0AY35_BRAAE|nr:unnamed protein product [Brassicogethes aeneus]